MRGKTKLTLKTSTSSSTSSSVCRSSLGKTMTFWTVPLSVDHNTHTHTSQIHTCNLSPAHLSAALRICHVILSAASNSGTILSSTASALLFTSACASTFSMKQTRPVTDRLIMAWHLFIRMIKDVVLLWRLACSQNRTLEIYCDFSIQPAHSGMLFLTHTRIHTHEDLPLIHRGTKRMLRGLACAVPWM